MLYLIRHTDAVDLEPDAARPLSAEGRDQVKRVAAFLRGCGEPPPQEIWHSPLVRARETAAGLATYLGWKAPLQAVAGLQPEDDPRRLVARLNAVEHGLAVIGHNPHLTTLATLLVTGRDSPPAFTVRKGAVIALEYSGSAARGWVVQWHVDADLFGGR